MARGTVQQAEEMIRDALADRCIIGYGYGYARGDEPMEGCALCALYLGAGGEEEGSVVRLPRVGNDGYQSRAIFDFLTSEALDAPFATQDLIDLEGGYEDLTVGAVYGQWDLPVQESDFYRLGEKLRLERQATRLRLP